MKERKQKLKFTKMSACSNDYIYINLFDKENTVSSPNFCPSTSATGTTAWGATA